MISTPLCHPSVMQNLNLLIPDDSNGKSFEGPEHLSRCYDGCQNLMLGPLYTRSQQIRISTITQIFLLNLPKGRKFKTYKEKNYSLGPGRNRYINLGIRPKTFLKVRKKSASTSPRERLHCCNPLIFDELRVLSIGQFQSFFNHLQASSHRKIFPAKNR